MRSFTSTTLGYYVLQVLQVLHPVLQVLQPVLQVLQYSGRVRVLSSVIPPSRVTYGVYVRT